MEIELLLRDNKKTLEINISTPTDIHKLTKLIRKNSIEVIVITTDFGDNMYKSIDFLEELSDKNRITELHIMLKVVDFSPIYKFKNLRKLTLCHDRKGVATLKMNVLPELEDIHINGNILLEGLECSKLQNLLVYDSNVFQFHSICENITCLHIIKSPLFDFKQAIFLPKLKSLVVTQLNITSLNGIEHLKNIKNVSINYCRKLKDISKIAECTELKIIQFESCKNIENFETLANLKKVVGLIFFVCGSIPSLHFIHEMTSLQFLGFVDTIIVDGDLTPCLRLENARTFDKKHYNIKAKDLPRNKECTFHNLLLNLDKL